MTAAVEDAERSDWVVQVAVELLVGSHQPFLLFIGLVQLRELWTVEKVRTVVSSEACAD